MAKAPEAAPKENEAGQAAEAGFAIEKLYVKDASIEVPNAPQIFTDRTPPQVNVELGNSATKLDDGVFEVAIKVTVTARLKIILHSWLKLRKQVSLVSVVFQMRT